MDKKELERRLDRLCSTLTRCSEPRCFTCGKRLDYADRQAGHFIPRIVKGARWNLDNLHTQCYKCNVYKGGNISRYREKLEKKFPSTLKDLDDTYVAYQDGILPEPSYEYKAMLYNYLLDRLRAEFPRRAQFFSEWQKIELCYI